MRPLLVRYASVAVRSNPLNPMPTLLLSWVSNAVLQWINKQLMTLGETFHEPFILTDGPVKPQSFDA